MSNASGPCKPGLETNDDDNCLTLRGRAAASSNAMVPMRLDARSVMRRVARASRPFSVGFDSSCLTYFPGVNIEDAQP